MVQTAMDGLLYRSTPNRGAGKGNYHSTTKVA